VKVDCVYRIDFLIEEVVVEIKSVSAIEPIHEAQLLTYMKLGQRKLGLLINFNVPVVARNSAVDLMMAFSVSSVPLW
jgi:GxxExxY protein